jgi:hypothetical protein
LEDITIIKLQFKIDMEKYWALARESQDLAKPPLGIIAKKPDVY